MLAAPSRRRVGVLLALVLGCVLGTSTRARAQGGDAADALRREGETLLVENRYGEACPKLSESYRLDPATSTLLGLAMCHEGEGKLASAWTEFVEVANRSPREGRDDRAGLARERADALRPRLSYVLIQVSPQAAQQSGLEVKQDGIRIDPASFGQLLPVDPGEHVVEASASGKTPWKKPYTVGSRPTQETIAVPALGSLVAEVETSRSRAEASPGGLTEVQIAGLITAGVGVVGIVVGSVSAIRAIGKQHDSDPQCDDFNRCSTPGAVRDRRDAVQAAGFATVSMVTGGFLVLGGATMFLLGGRSKPADAGRMSARPALLPGGGGVALSGRF
jgi:hypothetical protein